MANVKRKSDSIQTLRTPKINKKIAAIKCLDDDDDVEVDDESPLRAIFCLKRKSAIKEYDDKEDCFILDFNPEEDASLDLSDRPNNLQDSPDICLVAEKGQVACRDYPHSRHLCVKFPFEKTSHETFCKLCYCFVCDVAAPCMFWSGLSGHCHAIDNEGWKAARKMLKKG
ncbi:hypothetical protein SSX86_003588 [Deinandra increscens subsp. villosa]|uniref:Uncharacterized protein n=1 Tax=Deinandra increscens subsp. villosa TaxID=3103831 RepID=A0AAP0DHJ3_9ASTR